MVGGWPFVIAVTAVVAVACGEYFHAVRTARWGVVIGVGLAAFQVLAAHGSPGWGHAALIAAVAVPALWPVLAVRPATALADWSAVTLGVMYYGWLGSHAVLLRELPDGRDWLFVGLFGVFATDSGAYFVGRSIGRHHLAPRISPHKTWEGAVGGWAGGLIVILVLRSVFGLPLSGRETFLLALVLPVIAQLGDLAKSALKRSVGVKDFGRIMPGHGGMADRIDSLLFAVPVLYFWLQWV